MTRKTRTILFTFFVFLFCIITPLIVLYSQGYRFNFRAQEGEKRVVKTGGFYFKVWPDQVEIQLDNKGKKKKTEFLFGSLLWQNLLPKNYKIKIEKEGFQPWQKTLAVKEKMVTEIKNILLFPQKLEYKNISQNVQNFWAFPDGKKFILEKINPLTEKSGVKNWRLSILDTTKNVQSLLIEESLISKKELSEIKSLLISQDSKKILLNILSGATKQNYIVEINGQTQTSPPLSLSFLGEGFGNIEFNKNNSQKIFLTKNRNLYEIDLNNTKPRILGTSKTKAIGLTEIQRPILENILAYTQNGDNLYCLQFTAPRKNGEPYLGTILKIDSSGKILEKTNEIQFNIVMTNYYNIFVSDQFLSLQENQNLLIFDKESKSFKNLVDNFQDLKISSDSQKIAIISNNQISVLYLKDTETQPQRKAGELVLLTKFSGEIKDFFWLNLDYIILNNAGKINIIEIDNRNNVQNWNIGEFDNSQLFYNQEDKKLYVLNQENLFLADNLLK